MSKATIALLITWFVIGIGAAFYGGYYYGRHQTAKIQTTESGQTIEQKNESGTVKTTPTTSSSPSATSSSEGTATNVVN